MNLTILNKTDAQKSYLGGLVVVGASDQLTVARDLNVIIAGDSGFISDIQALFIALSTGSGEEFSGQTAMELIKLLGAFSSDPLATLFLYYSAIVNIRQTATTAANSTVWAMRNPLASPYSMVIERIFLRMAFDPNTPLTGINLQRYDLRRFSAATPTDGTQITPVKASTLAPDSLADVRVLDTGLTVAGVSFESPFAGISCPEIQGAVSGYERSRVYLRLAPGEGLAIRLSDVDASIGQSLVGEVCWSLR